MGSYSGPYSVPKSHAHRIWTQVLLTSSALGLKGQQVAAHSQYRSLSARPGGVISVNVTCRQSRLIEEEGNATRRAFNLINHALDSLDCLPHRTRHLSNSYQVARERVWSGVSAEEYPAQVGIC